MTLYARMGSTLAVGSSSPSLTEHKSNPYAQLAAVYPAVPRRS